MKNNFHLVKLNELRFEPDHILVSLDVSCGLIIYQHSHRFGIKK